MDQRILVTQAIPGMELARPVLLPDRMVLVGEGAVLTDAMITQMLKRSIKRIVVRGLPIDHATQGDYGARMTALKERFSRVDHIPLMRALHDLVARNLAKRF